MKHGAVRSLVEQAAAPYRKSGRFAWHFARGKLGHDPVFLALLRQGLFQTPVSILDVGCGQALLAHWLLAAAQSSDAGHLPAGWPDVAPYRRYTGLDLMAADIRRGETSMPERARLICADMCSAPFEAAERIVLLDVLHYVSPGQQCHVLDKIKAALTPEGCFILRVGDASAGWRAWQSRLTDQLVMLGRGRGWGTLHARPLTQWVELLEARGFTVESIPMHDGPAFANTLLIARHAA